MPKFTLSNRTMLEIYTAVIAGKNVTAASKSLGVKQPVQLHNYLAQFSYHRTSRSINL